MRKISPILLEVIEGTIESSMVEMNLQVDRTARSTVIREQHDHRAGIFDARGRSVSSVSFAANVDPILNRYPPEGIREGDIFIWNDCYKSEGGITHLPDICVTTPVVYEGMVMAFVQVFGHVEDVGGIVTGSLPITSTEIYQEGIMIPPVKLYDQGRLNNPLYETILNNSRFPDSLRGDIDAEVSSLKIGVRRLTEILNRYGREAVEECFEFLLERCARDLKEVAFPQIPDGVYPFEDFLEYGGIVAAEPRRFLRIKATLTKTPDQVTFDFTGTDAQVKGSLNWPGNERYYAKFLGTLFKPLIPEVIINDGALRVIRVISPKGTLLSPEFPAACSNRHWTLLRMMDTGMGCLAKALRGQVPGASEAITIWGFFGCDARGKPFFLREITGAGSGGRSYADGSDAVDIAPESKNMPCEFAETFFPVTVNRLGLRQDSGGPGIYRGGLGYYKELTFLAGGTFIVEADRVSIPPWGVHGGKPGMGNRFVLNPETHREKVLSKTDGEPIRAGDRLRILTPGGGGWGDPLERDPEAARLDAIRGLVSPEAVRKDYGVVLDPQSLMLDLPGTQQRREELRAQRGPLKVIDRGEGFEQLLREGQITLTVPDECL